MKFNIKIFRLCLLVLFVQLLSGCMLVRQEQNKAIRSTADIKLQLQQFPESDFKQVEATFFSNQSKELVFRVLSNIKQTPQWLQRVEKLEVLAAYNNQQYLLRTIINSPWPFKNRELITCVNNSFAEKVTTINILSCSERVPVNHLYVRLLQVQSSWTITKVSDSLVEINYKAWIDPSGNVPAFIFNRELIANTEADLNSLKKIIDNASLDQYSY